MIFRCSMIPLLAGATLALCLLGCGVEQAKPVPAADEERWGHLPPDAERPQQAEHSAFDPGTRQG